MTSGDWIAIALGLLTAVGIGWQIRRDLRKDSADRMAAAVNAARADALIEERVRRLEGRPADDE